jgi:rhodanese-related sulfurtransferase
MRKRSFIEALGVLLFSAFIAVATNYVRSDGLPGIREIPAHNTGLTNGKQAAFLSLDAFLEVMQHPGVLILDARPAEDYEEAHIPGAQSLPETEWADHLPLVMQDHAFDDEIIVYCSGFECGSAEEVAVLLQDFGYMNVRVYAGGWEEWLGHKLRLEFGD